MGIYGGLAPDLFLSGGDRWLGVQLQAPGYDEQERLRIVTVPYASKACDAHSLGGKPASAFLLAPRPQGPSDSVFIGENVLVDEDLSQVNGFPLAYIVERNSRIGSQEGIKLNQLGPGDATLSLLISGQAEWVVDVDHSYSLILKISNVTGGSDFTEKGITVDMSGRVGLGTSIPDQALEVNGGMQLNTNASKPSCEVTVRGTFWFTQGGVGIQDTAEVCAKDSANAYAWSTLY